MNKIPYGRQFEDSLDIKSVVNSLKEDLITKGNYIKNLKVKFNENFF